MIPGVLFGLCAAFFQSGSYLFSKRYVTRYQHGSLSLLAAGHCIMGLFACALLAFFLPRGLPPLSSVALPLGCGVASYLVGQAAFFLSLRRADASRVSPLLGLKIIILAAVSVSLLRQHFGVLQWIGIAVSLGSAYMLGSSGSRLSLSGWAFVGAACFFYSVSDLCMKELIIRFSSLGLFSASLVSACLCYALAGIAAACLLPFVNARSKEQWKAALPFAVFWFVGILFLFGCFGCIGVVFGNIVQSTRGIMSLAMGWVVARLGHEHIEKRITARVFGVRIAAGCLMVAAIALFNLG